ncbi:hypothetical protein AB0B13_33030 [Streptomyces sp. NPDC042898]|uniref:hypothetical protein n=1 Tax=Streptomyces sp. NPDC042898 TaxID=3154334 RepID=UPI0033EBCB51
MGEFRFHTGDLLLIPDEGTDTSKGWREQKWRHIGIIIADAEHDAEMPEGNHPLSYGVFLLGEGELQGLAETLRSYDDDAEIFFARLDTEGQRWDLEISPSAVAQGDGGELEQLLLIPRSADYELPEAWVRTCPVCDARRPCDKHD